jgi:hypothetical protein
MCAALSSSAVSSLPCGSDLFQLPRLGESLATTKACRNFARVDPVHDNHRDPHDQRVEDVEEDLVGHDEAVVALGVLNHSHDRTHEDQDADEVQGDHVLLPGRSVAFGGGLLAEARVKDGCCDDEEAEDYHLHDETGDDDVVAHVDAVDVTTGEKSSTCTILLATEQPCNHIHSEHLPEDCIRKESTSPVTNSFVSQVLRMNSDRSPSTISTILPNSM